ncbi:polysaccharide deacetylase family protein [Lihuaxuella thermophila]|uniref:Peptidoglycan/xylan/chitin deacetylase, PgdA/CDA1 family n=1 Tax=Lihuaxuella thermophila TaxID=1173111 RepID=A0A1H8FUC9_9BACL|nr:polysaccharide deacetylase family protein [Lihuaxuella thermophila]SEN35144.1 Peptidoglycan/xylan/chitin deacetylase, PgdA/CDA1 family [Lihuaxuella thermophila]
MHFWGKVGAAFLFFSLMLAGCAQDETNLDAAKPSVKPPQKVAHEHPESTKATKEKVKEKPAKPVPKAENQPEEKVGPKGITVSAKMNEKEKQVQPAEQILFFKGPKTIKKVALTFDDGPDRYYTIQILNILKREQVPATFFVIGNMAQKYPDVLKRIDQEGHVVGNHSWNHPQLTKISAEGVNDQIFRTNEIIHRTLGKTPMLIRPPYGSVNERVERQLGSKGFKIINWSVDTLDWRGRSSKRILKTVKNQIQPGGIILQHSAGPKGKLNGTIQALPEIITYLKQNGYQFVTVDELLQVPPYAESAR